MPMNPVLLNREFQPPADGWFQIVPLGEFPVLQPSSDSGQPLRRLVQVVDQVAIEAMAADFANRASAANFAGILVDYDHFSMDTDHLSTAAGWIQNVAMRPDGLYAQVRWTPAGEAAITTGEYRFCSPVFSRTTAQDLGRGRVRCTKLLSVALTNDPNMKGMHPLSNRADAGAQPMPDNGRKDKQKMKEVLTLLGLPETATEAEAVAVLKNRGTRLAELEARDDAAQADADLKPYEALLADGKRDEVKALLIANRDAGLKLLGALKPAAATLAKPATKTDALPNRKSAAQPASAAAQGDDQDAARANKIRNRAAEIQRELKVPFRLAFQRAAAETAAP